MPWVSPSTRATDYLVTAGNWNELVTNFLFLNRVAYVEFTADVSVTATTVGTANQIVSAGAITYENVPHEIVFHCGSANPGSADCNVILRDSTTVLGTMTRLTAGGVDFPVYVARVLTPSAASHTYNVAAWNVSAATAVFNAGTGGAAGDSTTDLPGFISVTRVPT